MAGIAAAVASYFLFFSKESVEPGPYADNPKCADVISRAPETVLSKHRDDVTGEGVASWGDGSVVLRCGVTPLRPTTNLCVDVNSVDWVLDEKRANKDGVQVLTTYGRTPAVEITVEGDGPKAGDALVDVNRAVRSIPQKSKCLSLSDTL
ncbi:DUF3515 family protein [Streptomyces himastatinicus]|uniref:DUF3515 family protein n=1 Tax=Streptomyces himastatinicus TaxID=998084 RepID=UPI00142F3911|nr:DUF3515 family protein [Streptomyces himastatinicus]